MEKFRPENSEPANTKHRRRHHAPTRRSGRRGEILKKCVEILENLRSQVSDLRKEAELEEENGETAAPEKTNEEVGKLEAETPCFRNQSKQFFSLAKEECDLDAGKEESKPEEKLEVDMGSADKESLTEERPPEPPEPPDCRMFKEAVEFHDRCAAMMYGSDQTRNKAPDGGVTSTGATSSRSGEMVLSREIALCDEKEAEKMTRRSIGTAERFGDDDDWRRSPEERDGGATVTEGLVRVARRKFHSLVTGWCDKGGRERKVRAESISGKLGLLTDPMGQAPYMFFAPTKFLVSNSDLFNVEKGVLKVISGKEKNMGGSDWVLKEVNPTPKTMGQAQILVIKSTQFKNKEGVFQEKQVATTVVGLFPPISDMLSHVSQRDFPTAEQHISVDISQVSLTSLIADAFLSPTYLGDMHIELVPFDKYVACIEKMKTTLHDSQNDPIEVVKLSKLLMGVGGNYNNGSMQLTNISILEMDSLVHQWELGGLKKYGWDPGGNKRDVSRQSTSAMGYGWDPGGNKRDVSRQSTSAMGYQGNQTQQYYWYHQVLFICQQITNLVDNYGAVSMSSRVLKNPLIRVVQFNDEMRWLKIANGIENRQLLFSAGEILNWKPGIGAEINAASGNQGVYGGNGRGMYSNNLHIKNVLLYCHLVAKIRSHKPPLLYNTWKAWLGKSSNGFKHSKSNKRVKLENETNIQGIGAMRREFVMGRTTKKINDVQAFKDLLQADKGVKKGPRKSNIDLEIGKTYLAQSPKALMEICVEHLIGGSEFSRMQWWEALLKTWDPSEPYLVFCTSGTSCFKLRDPGGRLETACFWYLHLEDKVNSIGGSIVTNEVNEGQQRQFTKVYERKKWRKTSGGPTAAQQCTHSHTQLILPRGRI